MVAAEVGREPDVAGNDLTLRAEEGLNWVESAVESEYAAYIRGGTGAEPGRAHACGHRAITRGPVRHPRATESSSRPKTASCRFSRPPFSLGDYRKSR